jgi:soluble lytic murein transglycosylase
MDNLTSARAEWNYALERMSDKEQLAVAQIALNLGWYDQSIRTANHAEAKDALKYRFPDAFREPLMSYSKQNSLQSPWVFAVARQESMFIYDAKSPAGALGLLQVMPETAKRTASKNGIPYSNSSNLLEPQKNIQIGSAYLRNMLDFFDNDPVLATAAYNAGPGRVQQWLAVRPTTDDVWVETIPFKETRQYVQNVLAFTVLYAHRLDMDKNVTLPAVSAATHGE